VLRYSLLNFQYLVVPTNRGLFLKRLFFQDSFNEEFNHTYFLLTELFQVKFYSNLQLLKMISNHNALILSLLSLVVSISSLWTEERRETSRNQLSEENITRALIDMTQETLLRSFGIDVSRKPSKAFTPHDYMIDIYSVLSGDSDAARRTRINTVRGIMDTDTDNEDLFHVMHQVFHFNVGSIPKEEEVLNSEFRLLWSPLKVASRLRRRSRGSNRKKLFQVVILGVTPKQDEVGSNTTSYKRLKVTRLATKVFNIEVPHQKWISFNNIGDFSRGLQKDGLNVMKLAAYVVDMSNGKIVAPSDVGFDKRNRRDKEKGLLVIFSEDKTKKKDEDIMRGRRKRGARRGRGKGRKHHLRRRNKALCRRRKMYVNFEDFGWTNWIMAPTGYEAYYCRGSCAYPIPGHLNPTSHAVIQSTISSMNSQFMKPACCVPDKLRSIAMLYLDHNDRVVYHKKEDMVVVSCACR